MRGLSDVCLLFNLGQEILNPSVLLIEGYEELIA